MTRHGRDATRNDVFAPVTNGQTTVTAMIQKRVGTVVAVGSARTVLNDDDEAIDELAHVFKAVAWLCGRKGVKEIVLDFRGLKVDRDSSLRLHAMRQTLESPQRIVHHHAPTEMPAATPAAPARTVTTAVSRFNEVVQALTGTAPLVAHLLLAILNWSLYIWWRLHS